MINTFVLLICIVLPYSISVRPQINISDGTLIGTTMKTWMGRKIVAFLGLPFAAPPVGPLRFMPPQPVLPWTWPRDAGSFGNQCSQLPPGGPQYLPDLPQGHEDCLYLNVYTPMLPSNNTNQELLPVLIYFHGGSFIALNGSYYGPRYLLDHNLVLVTTNYRLGVLGFLSSGDSVVPGNMGLKDQVAALQWIKKNIAAFGGNPDEVTISGTSAGSISVQMHFMSRLSRGLFKRGICQSGSVFMPIAQQKAPLNKFYTFAKLFNCTSNSTSRIVNCLRKITDYSLVEAQRVFQGFYSNPTDVFGPVVEHDLPTSFLSQLSYEYVRTGELANLPMLLTTVLNEGLLPSAAFINNSTALRYINANWDLVAPYILDYTVSVSSRNRNPVSEKVREYYFGSQPISRNNTQTLVQLVGDRNYNNDIENVARLITYTHSAPVYFARFAYRGRESVTNLLTGTNINFGVSHADDIFYVFNISSLSAETSASDRQMINIISGVWSNFTITGVPRIAGVEWDPLDRSNSLTGPLNFLMISSPTIIEMSTTTTLGHPQFWNNLPISEPWAGRPLNTGV